VLTYRHDRMVKYNAAGTHWWHVSVYDHNILISFIGKLICQRQAKDTGADYDDPVTWTHHGRNMGGQCVCELHV